MSKEIIRAIIKGKWCITEDAATAYLPTVYNILSSGLKTYDEDDRQSAPQKTPEQIREEKECAMVGLIGPGNVQNASFIARSARLSAAEPNSIVVLKYHDVIIKNDDGCGNPGTEFFAEMISNAADNPNISAIILDIDTPGGDGTAVQRPSAAIIEARKKKPVLLYAGNGMVASAGYWFAAQTDEIYTEYATDEVGSIGTYITLIDRNAFMASFYNTKVESVYASKSTAKNKGQRDWTKGNSEYLIKHTLDPFNEEFINAVKAGRGDRVKDEVFDGRLVMSQEALSFGLIDGMKTFAEVIERARELSSSKNNSNGNQMKVLVTGLDNTVDAINAGTEANVDQINQANVELNARGLRLVSEADFTALQAKANENENNTNTLTQKVESLQSTIKTTATALGLSGDTEFKNANGETVTLDAQASALVAEKNTLAASAGKIETVATAEEEIKTEEEFLDPSLKYYNENF